MYKYLFFNLSVLLISFFLSIRRVKCFSLNAVNPMAKKGNNPVEAWENVPASSGYTDDGPNL